MKRFFLILCLLLPWTLHASPLWNGSQTGMQPADILRKFEGAEATSVQSDRVGIGMEKARIPSIPYQGQEFSVHFYFNDGGLHAVTLKLKKIGSRAKSKKLVEAIVEDLSKTLGKPQRHDDVNLASQILKATWTTPDREVVLFALNYGADPSDQDGALVINYGLPEAEPAKGQPFPPVPAWEPEIVIPLEKVIDRFRYYTDGGKDFVVLKHGTCVIVSDGLSDEAAGKEALEIVSKIFNYHPDMDPKGMDDGNIMIFYNHPAYSVVLDEITKANIDTIRKNHLKALARDEVMMTPGGANKFDEHGMKALFGRCYFFMDAKKPEVAHIIRKGAAKPKPAAPEEGTKPPE